MHYYVRDGDIIKKYRVTYDKERLEKLRLEIINNCSEISHFEYDATNGPLYHEDNMEIRNLKIENSSKPHNDHLYHYSYDKYVFPYLATLITLLLSQHNIHALHIILNPDYKMEKEPFDKRIEELNKMINVTSNLDTKKKIELLKKLEDLISLAKLNVNQKNVSEYYKKVQEAITLELIDTLHASQIEQVDEFLATEAETIPIFQSN